MSFRLLAESRPVARKEHKCIWCGENILKGETYRRERSIYEEMMQDHKWHLECNSAAAEFFADGAEEFSPHDNPRGEQPE